MEKQTNIEHLVKLLTEILSKGIHVPTIRRITETEARSLSARIKEITGQAISSKTLGNYYKAAETEKWSAINPTLFTLDILAFFILSKENSTSPPSENGLNWLKFQNELENKRLSAKKEIILQHNPERKKNTVILFSTLVMVSLVTLMIYSHLKIPKDFYDPFDEVSYSSLLKRGWEILDLDTSWLNNQIKPGYLTLYTLPGDHWVKPNEKPFVKNTLIYKIDEKQKVQIEIEIIGFKPYQEYHQVGLVLFDKNKAKENLIRFNFSFGYSRNVIESLDCFNDIQLLDLVDIKPLNANIIHSFQMTGWKDVRGNTIDMNLLTLKIIIEKFKLKFYARSGKSFDPFLLLKEYDSDFIPGYAGLFSFQGQSDAQYRPWNADTIPAFMDNFKISYVKTK